MFPLDLTGPEFLPLYIASILTAHVAAQVYRGRRVDNGSGCTEHPLHINLDPYEIAYLRGGKDAVVDAAVAGFVHSKVLEPADDVVRINKDVKRESHPIADELLSRLKTDSLPAKDMRQTTEGWKRETLFALPQLQDKLEKNGFVLTDEAAGSIKFWSAMIAASPLLIGVPKIWIGTAHGKPVTFLVALVAFSFFSAMLYLVANPRRTSRGEAALSNLKHSNEALKTTAYSNSDGMNSVQIATAAALFGSTIFASGLISDYQKRIAPPSAGGSGCGSSCSSGGSCGGGGCGGGCGGCGG